jgi:hypothetical protein
MSDVKELKIVNCRHFSFLFHRISENSTKLLFEIVIDIINLFMLTLGQVN